MSAGTKHGNSWLQIDQCVRRGFWDPCDSSCQEDHKSVYLLIWANYQSLLTAFTALTQSKNVPVELHVGYGEAIILSGSTSQKYLFG